MKRTCVALAIGVALALSGCGKQGGDAAPAKAEAETGFAAELRNKLLDAKPGDVIEVPAGTFHFDRGLSLRVDGVTLRGQGRDKSILSFKGQKTGAEGLLVNANGFTLENLAIEDSRGDGFKISQAENVTVPTTSPASSATHSSPVASRSVASASRRA